MVLSRHAANAAWHCCAHCNFESHPKEITCRIAGAPGVFTTSINLYRFGLCCRALWLPYEQPQNICTPSPPAAAMGHKRHGHGAAHLSHVPARPTSPHSTAPAADQPQQGGVGQRFSPDQLQAMLGKRARMLGAGACGKVFAGELPGVGRVAVKIASAAGMRALANEAAVLQHIRHPSVVKALGSCWTEQCKAIVYEYLQSGTLDKHLGVVSSTIDSSGRAASSDAGLGHAKSHGKAARPCFNWQMRVRAAYQLACALAHLHNSVPHVLHRDVKPGNILLDTELNAYLGDMGIAKVSSGNSQHT